MGQRGSAEGFIRARSRALGLDPNAEVAVASREGGLLYGGAVGDHGTSFGPFQEHEHGALPRALWGRPVAAQAWAWSPAGIEHALEQQAHVARGLTGRAAVEAIVRGFERPADPSGEIAGALAAYGHGAHPAPELGAVGGAGDVPLSSQPGNSGLARALLASREQSGALNTNLLLSALLAARTGGQPTTFADLGTGQAPRPGTAPSGLNADFAHRLTELEQAVRAHGGHLAVTSGFRSVAEQRRLWTAAIAKYGSADAARKWVAPPGHSNHNKGLAADLGGDLELAHQLAPHFGLTFPLGNEAWHVEPEGLRG